MQLEVAMEMDRLSLKRVHLRLWTEGTEVGFLEYTLAANTIEFLSWYDIISIEMNTLVISPVKLQKYNYFLLFTIIISKC